MRRLYHIPLSPFCRKIRLILAEKKIEITLISEAPWENRLDFLRINPANRVPAYISERGHVICDSNAICEYLEEEHTAIPLLPSNPVSRAEVRRLVAWFDSKFHEEVTVNLLYEKLYKRIKKTGYPDSTRIRTGSNNIKVHLEYIEWLVEQRNWLAGDQISLADFAAAAHLSCIDYINNVPWAHSPAAKLWYSRVKSRPAFRSILADHIPGTPPPQHYANLDF